MKRYEIKLVKIADIQFDSQNPNKMSEEQLTALRKSLHKFGQLKPVIIDQTMMVCDGEHSVRAYQAEGWTEIQVIQNAQLVTDYCAGSGSTLIACEQTGRMCRAMEIDARYCSAIIQRWETLTNKKAVKL